ncbi:MAG: exosortase H-associated membrane protein [Halieaceae bacterium]
MKKATVKRFFGFVVVLLPAMFIVWHALGSVVAAPAVALSGAILQWWLPELISEVTLNGTHMVIAAAVGELNGALLPSAEAGNQLAFQLDTRTLSYSIPFYAALHFATPMHSSLERFARGLLILWLLIIIGLIFTSLKDLMLGLGALFFSSSVPPADAIALGYQFSVLMVPPVAPVLIWAFEARDVGLFPQLIETPVKKDTPQPASPES